ncbi:hypothetical protein, partial [Candidatus Sororendozoicomonas aggregata]|uniref:hypothetical protein n=1 Tax=Candidatus Sororendozoicomonas aggregata TaxID=3073239 RepID=UPI002ED0FCDC
MLLIFWISICEGVGGSKRKINNSSTEYCEKTETVDDISEQPPLKKHKKNDDFFEEIRKKVHYKLDDSKIESAQKFLDIAINKNILIKDSFYKLSGFIDEEVFVDFFSNAGVFFRFLPETVKNTGMITGMLGNRKKYIKDFAKRTHEELEFLAKEDALSSFSSMNNGKGLPKEEDVKKVKGWEVWKVGDAFSMELFRAFSSMNHGKGLPKEEDVKKVKGW